MNKNSKIVTIVLAVSVLLLLTMLAYPFGYDQAVFAVGGDMSIKHGAVTYRDFIDTKPPVIFWIYGVAQSIFGHREWAIRAFDILYQLFSLFVFYRILRSRIRDSRLIIGTIGAYILYYVASGYWMTAQAETFALLPAILVFHYTVTGIAKRSVWLNGLYAGIACGVLVLLKFTFLTVSIAAIVWCVAASGYNRKQLLRYCSGHILGLGGILIVYAGYLFETGSFGRFVESMQWLGGYRVATGTIAGPIGEDNSFKLYPGGLLEGLGFTGIVLLMIGIWQWFRSDRKDRPLFLFFLIQVFIGFAGILSEKKSMDYHYSRLFWAAIPIIVYGLIESMTFILNRFRQWMSVPLFQRTIRFAMVIPIAGLAIFYSPLLRVAKQPWVWTRIGLSGENAALKVQQTRAQQFNYDASLVADSLKNSLLPGESVFLFGNTMSIYFDLDVLPNTICLTNAPFITSWTIPSWRTELLRELHSTMPKFFIVETDDERAFANGTTLDSYQLFEQWNELHEFVQDNYKNRQTIGHFRIFERR